MGRIVFSCRFLQDVSSGLRVLLGLLFLMTLAHGKDTTNQVLSKTEFPHLHELEVPDLSSGDLKLRGPLPSFVKVWPVGAQQRQLEYSFNAPATEITLHLGKKTPKKLRFLLAENTTVCSNGVVVLSALDAKVVGSQAKLESHPGSHRIGYWNQGSDYVTWDTNIPAGNYQAELVYSRATPTGTRVTIAIGKKELPITLKKTGSWYRYRVVQLGELEVRREDETHVEVRVNEIKNGGVMNLKAIVLTPLKKKRGSIDSRPQES